jgi:hypothetical protein
MSKWKQGRIVPIVLLLVALTGVIAFAQGGVTVTNIQVQNLSDETATCHIIYYRTDGSIALEYDFTIDPNGTWSKYQGAETGLEDGFNGSVVISSDKPVAAIVNQKTTGGQERSGSYSGESAGSTISYAPIIMKEFYGFDTEISIQNASAGPVDVTVSYYDQAGNLVTGAEDECLGLATGAACRVNQSDNATLPTKFNGSGSVSATGPVVVVINQNGPNKQNTYNGFPSGGQTLSAPIVMFEFYKFKTAIQVQNVGGAQTRVRATYSDGIVVTSGYVQPNSSTSFYSWTEGHAPNFNGSVTITSLDGQDLVAMVNQTNDIQSSAYNAFAQGSTQFVLPTIMRNYYDYSTAMQIQNVSGALCDCVVTYDDGVAAVPVGSLTNIPPGASVLIANRTEIAHGDNYTGSATVVCTGDVVVVVNQGPNAELTKYHGFDASLAYNGMIP